MLHWAGLKSFCNFEVAVEWLRMWKRLQGQECGCIVKIATRPIIGQNAQLSLGEEVLWHRFKISFKQISVFTLDPHLSKDLILYEIGALTDMYQPFPCAPSFKVERTILWADKANVCARVVRRVREGRIPWLSIKPALRSTWQEWTS